LKFGLELAPLTRLRRPLERVDVVAVTREPVLKLLEKISEEGHARTASPESVNFQPVGSDKPFAL
jgi:hypothetical protein